MKFSIFSPLFLYYQFDLLFYLKAFNRSSFSKNQTKLDSKENTQKRNLLQVHYTNMQIHRSL